MLLNCFSFAAIFFVGLHNLSKNVVIMYQDDDDDDGDNRRRRNICYVYY